MNLNGNLKWVVSLAVAIMLSLGALGLISSKDAAQDERIARLETAGVAGERRLSAIEQGLRDANLKLDRLIERGLPR